MPIRMSLAIAAVAAVGPVAMAPGQNPGMMKRIVLASDAELGYYVALKDGEPKRLTAKEEDALIGQRASQDAMRRRPLAGVIEYSSTHGLSIAIQTDGRGDVNAKLRLLTSIPPDDVRGLVCIGQVDADGMKVLSGLSKLQELMIEATGLLEEKEGASQLARFQDLRYLEVVPNADRKFGSQSFCQACIGLGKLQYLAMPCEKLTDANVEMLATHRTLQRLYLRSTKPVLGRASLQALSRMKRLRELGIVCTDDITDSDVMGFAECQSLEFLSIATKSPLSCRERLEARRPGCKVFFVDLLDEFP